MSDTLNALREGRRIAKIRLGQAAPDFVPLKSNPDVRIALVPLTEAEYQQALEAAAMIDIPDNAYGIEVRDRTAQVHSLYHAIREPGDPSKKVFSSVESMLDPENGLEPIDINYLAEYYNRMIDFSSPTLEGLSDEQLDELKKALVTIDWSALSGKPWWHLRQFFMTLPAGVPLDNSPSLSSILNLIGTSEENESTPGASQT